MDPTPSLLSTYALSLKNAWGTCSTDPLAYAFCVTGQKMSELTSDLVKYVGSRTVESFYSVCRCNGNFGPLCTWSEAPKNNLCENGAGLNEANYLSGCECKNSNDEFIPYHGWYCEIHNRILCEDEEKFYDASKMRKVGDSSSRVCKRCEEIIKNCDECEQNEGK